MKSIFIKDTPSVYYHGVDYIKQIREDDHWSFTNKQKDNLALWDRLFIIGLMVLVLYFIGF